MKNMRWMLALCALGALGGVTALQAQVLDVKDAWVRATVAGQQATGAFMKITAPQGGRLLGVSSPAAALAEIHEMRMEGDVMKMRAIDRLELPAGKTVELRPGSYHVMLMNLKAPLKVNDTVALTLTFVDGQGAQQQEQVQVPVRLMAPAAPGMPDHGMHMKN